MAEGVLVREPDHEAGKPLTSLRARKKRQQHEALVETAAALFTRHGFENVRIEDIAAEADVSTKTVYNYFGSKRDILVAYMLDGRRRTMETQFQPVIDSISGDLGRDLRRMLLADIGDDFGAGDKPLWLEIVAVTVRDNADARFREIRWMFTGYIEALLAAYRDRGLLPGDAGLREIAHVVHLVYTDAFVDFCATPDQKAEEAIDRVLATLTGVFGWP